ncbi:eCIS core domain-containing protein, partial [Streptomyces sp. NPDC055085]
MASRKPTSSDGATPDAPQEETSTHSRTESTQEEGEQPSSGDDDHPVRPPPELGRSADSPRKASESSSGFAGAESTPLQHALPLRGGEPQPKPGGPPTRSEQPATPSSSPPTPPKEAPTPSPGPPTPSGREADGLVTARSEPRRDERRVHFSAEPPSLPASAPVVAPPRTRSLTTPLERVPASIASAFRSTYGEDLSQVPVHRDNRAASGAQAHRTRAFTRGGEVFLPQAEGPLSEPGARRLLAHELVHVVQQRRLGASLPTERSPEGLLLEAEAQRGEGLSSGSDLHSPQPLTHRAPSHSKEMMQSIVTQLVDQSINEHEENTSDALPPSHETESEETQIREVDQHLSAATDAGPVQRYADAAELNSILTGIKLEAVARSREGQYTPITLDSLSVEDQDQARREVQSWAEQIHAKSWPPSDEWFQQMRFRTHMDAHPSVAATSYGDLVALNHRVEAEVNTQIRLLRERDNELLSGPTESISVSASSLPRVPDVVGKHILEANELLYKAHRSATSYWRTQQYEGFEVRRYLRNSQIPKDVVIEASPGPNSIIMPQITTITLVVSRGPSAASSAAAALERRADWAASLLGVNLGAESRRRIRTQLGVTDELITEDEVLPVHEGYPLSPVPRPPLTTAGGQVSNYGRPSSTGQVRRTAVAGPLPVIAESAAPQPQAPPAPPAPAQPRDTTNAPLPNTPTPQPQALPAPAQPRDTTNAPLPNTPPNTPTPQPQAPPAPPAPAQPRDTTNAPLPNTPTPQPQAPPAPPAPAQPRNT